MRLSEVPDLQGERVYCAAILEVPWAMSESQETPGATRTPRIHWRTLGLALLVALACGQSVEQRLEAVRLQQEIGSWQESVDALREILESAPDHPEANLMLGRAQLRLGQPALAIWPLETASGTPELANQANLALGGAYLQLEQHKAALEAIAPILATPDDEAQRIQALHLSAAVHFTNKEWDSAIEQIDVILESDPENLEAKLLRANVLVGAGRHDEAGEVLEAVWQDPELRDTPVSGQAGLALVRLYGEHLKDPKRAETQLEAVVERFPTSREALDVAVATYTAEDRPERATELLRRAVELEPADIALRGILARHLSQLEQDDEAEAVLVEATELQNSPSSWLALSEFRRTIGKYPEAVVALERVLEQVPGVTDDLRFRHANLLADAGELDRADGVAGEITDEMYSALISGRLAYERGRPGDALELLDRGLRRWPNNSGARFLAGRSALQLGQLDRAVGELREAIRVDPAGTDAALELAQLQLAQGQPQDALGTLAMMGRIVEAVPPPERQRAGMILTARAQAAKGELDKARVTLTALAETDPVTAAVERAQIEADADGPRAAIRAIEASKVDLARPESQPALRALCQWLVADGRTAEALRRVDGVLAAHPEDAQLHELRGRVLLNLNRVPEARAALEKALELDPQLAPAMAALARFAVAEGDTDGARTLLERAGEADRREPSYPFEAAQVSLMAGNEAQAEAFLRETLRRDPVHGDANNNLAWMMAERGEDLDQALTLARRARRTGESAAVLDTLGWVLVKRGDYEQAVQTLNRARELEPDSPSIAYRLSLALIETGERDQARDLLRNALSGGGSFPEADAARQQLDRLASAES